MCQKRFAATHKANKEIHKCQEHISTIKKYFNVRFPLFSSTLESHITDTFMEFSSSFNGFFTYLQSPRITSIQCAHEQFPQQLFFKAFIFGQKKAHLILESITSGSTVDRIQLRSDYGNLHSIKQNIISRTPNIAEHLNELIRELIDVAQEMEEVAIERIYRPGYANLDDKAVVNLTNLVLPTDIQLCLSFGPKFVFAPNKDLYSLVHFLDDFCHHLESNFPVETFLEAYKQLSIEMHRDALHFRNDRDIWLDFLRYRIMKFKHTHSDVCIARSDKGKHTVLIYKNDYTNKMNDLVENSKDYIELPEFNIQSLEEKNNYFVKCLSDLQTVDGLSIDNCTFIAKMYGLIKIHKHGYPVRPITAACSAPGFKLAKALTHILDTIFPENGFHIKNSASFVLQLSKIQIADSDTMMSFDVISMFTNIPIDHMIELIKKRETLIMSKYKIPFQLFKEILEFLLCECAIFSWNSKIYRQNDSLAMGSPLSPILAKILMTNIIDFILPLIPSAPKFLALYVDDSFWIADSAQIDFILAKLNSYHHRIQFTVEKESNGQINFLDTTIIKYKEDDHFKLLTRWYKKSFASSRLLNYFSFHEKSCIIETARAYIKMVLKLSSGEFFHENKFILETILRKNSFPETEIMALMRENYTFMKPLTVKPKEFTGRYIPIKYRGNLTQRIKQKIHPFLPDARLVGTPDRVSTKHFSHLKDEVDVSLKTNVVLIFTCSCKEKRIIRHTNFRGRASEIMDSMKSNDDTSSSSCTNGQHVFSKIKCIQCKNFSSTIRTHSMISYAYRDAIADTVFCLPQYYITKCLNLDKYTQQ